MTLNYGRRTAEATEIARCSWLGVSAELMCGPSDRRASATDFMYRRYCRYNNSGTLLVAVDSARILKSFPNCVRGVFILLDEKNVARPEEAGVSHLSIAFPPAGSCWDKLTRQVLGTDRFHRPGPGRILLLVTTRKQELCNSKFQPEQFRSAGRRCLREPVAHFLLQRGICSPCRNGRGRSTQNWRMLP